MPPRDPKVSVLINNYNNAPYLEHCLESVFSQVPPADEVIFYDDGSTDESLKIIERYAWRMQIIARPHGSGSPMENQANAIETAFRASTGDLLLLLDGDDAFLPGKIAAYMAAYVSAPDVVMVQAPLDKIDGEGRSIGVEFEAPRHQDDYLAHIYAENELNIYYPTSSLAFSRAYLEKMLPLKMSDGRKIWPDARLALIAPLHGKVIALSEPFSQWRRHSQSHTVVKAPSIYRLVRINQQYFNAYCRQAGFRPITPWRSRHHRRRWARHYLVPDFCVEWLRRVRWATLSEQRKRQMMSGPTREEMVREIERLRRKGLVSS